MSAPAIVPKVPSNPEPLPFWAQDLKIDEPDKDGPKVGDDVICWQGELEPKEIGRKVCGKITLVGHNRRVSVSLFPPDFVALVIQNAVIPHDDPDARGKWPSTWRWKPAEQTLAFRAVECNLTALEAKVAELAGKNAALSRTIDEIKVSLKKS